MKTGKFIAIVLAVLLLFANLAYASDISSSSNLYDSAITRLSNLGIMADTPYNSEILISRGEFAEILAKTSGLGDEAIEEMGSTIFPDVSDSSELSGYINVVVKKGLMTGTADRKFHPDGNITFLQSCTIIVKALGYTTSDLTGIWPYSYVTEAKKLGLADGINMKNNDKLTEWAAAVMINRMLDTNIKKTNTTDADKTYAESSGLNADSFEYAGILNPVYSKPVVVKSIDYSNNRVGNLNFSNYINIEDGMTIIRNGQIASFNDINYDDVVYKVSDSWGEKQFILVVSNTVRGTIKSIGPNMIYPETIIIGNTTYSFSKDMDFSEIRKSADDYSYGTFEVGDNVRLILGCDGKVLEITW